MNFDNRGLGVNRARVGSIPFMFLLFTLSLFFSPAVLAEEYNLRYDDNGNLIESMDKQYTYNVWNQLSEVRDVEGNLLEEYIYDHNGRRIKKVQHFADGKTETTYYVNNYLVRVVNAEGTFDTYSYRDNTGTLLAKKNPDRSIHYYHPDLFGSTTLITDTNGNTIEETSYFPFGAIQQGGNDRYAFTGQEKDESGLLYYGARYYDSELHHFTQPDTIIPDKYNPQTLNGYSYALNNPYRYVDPSGHYAIENGKITWTETVNDMILKMGIEIMQEQKAEQELEESASTFFDETWNLINKAGTDSYDFTIESWNNAGKQFIDETIPESLEIIKGAKDNARGGVETGLAIVGAIPIVGGIKKRAERFMYNIVGNAIDKTVNSGHTKTIPFSKGIQKQADNLMSLRQNDDLPRIWDSYDGVDGLYEQVLIQNRQTGESFLYNLKDKLIRHIPPK